MKTRRRPRQGILFNQLSRVALGIVAFLTYCSARAQPAATHSDLTELPIETLLQLEVTTVSRKPEKLAESPAAVSVITQEDIHRSGVTSIAEALRLAPGLEVARVDASQWAISARGFNDAFANKLLVLQDGRSVYTPLFSGVFWDVQGTMLEDIDRIEVIRGPGAALWGANAVNGVINIITRSAKDTQGTLLTAGGGTEERAFAGIRYGDKLSENSFFRVYGTYFNRDNSVLANGNDAHDSWQMGRWGFRLDWDVSDRNLVTIQGDAYRGSINQVFGTFDPSDTTNFFRNVQDNFEVVGGNLLGRWTTTLSPESDLRVQAYYDRTERDTVIFKEKRDTFDIDFQHRFPLGQRNDVVWGLGYRLTSDQVGNTPTIALVPDSRTLNLFSGFLQDEIALVPDKLRLTLGSKFEHNDFTGVEIQPSGRLLWTPTEHQTAWASVSRAVRTPSRAEENIQLNRVIPAGGLFPGSPVAVSTIFGNEDLESEKLLAYELGYRIQPAKQVSFDLAAFYNDYDDLRTIELGFSPTQGPTPPPAGALFIPMHAANHLYGETYGLEAAATWEITHWWRLQPAYTYLQMQLHKRAGSTDTSSELDEGKSPHNQFTLRSSMDFPRDISLDCTLRYVDNLPALQIDSYIQLDLRIAWRPIKNLELALVGQNLLDDRHAEFRPSFIATQQAEIQRGFYGKVTWRF